ncbi:MAG TPA: VOC family protein [Candidatus Angelobacter sp.]|nr:VOC family protein [Candidatus Angelobacter sp.]
MVGRNLSAKGLEWVEARVQNYEEMKKFYRRTLGLPLNFEEERKDFIQFKVGPSKTYLALLDTKKTGMARRSGFVPTFEVPDLDKFVRSMKKKGVKVGRRVAEGDHVRLVDFFDPNGNLLQAFEWKHKQR